MKALLLKARFLPFVLFVTVFLSTFIVYLLTLARSLVAYGDAPEFVVAVLTNGIPHPSGYPLFVLLGKLAILLPFHNKIMLINGVSAVFGSLTCCFAALIVYKFTRSFFSSFLAALILGFSFLFWKNSVVSEVFTLNTFFAAILIYLVLTINSQTRYYMFAIFAGLSLANHPTILLIFPGLFYLLWKQRKFLSFKNHIVSIFLFLICGLLPYSYLWWAGQKYPLQNWENTASLSGVFNIMIRKAYGVIKSGSGYVPHDSFSQQIMSYLSITTEQFTFTGIALFSLGLFILFRSKKDVFIIFLSCFLLSGIVFILYSKFPLGDISFRVQTERFLLLSEMFFVIIIGIGSSFILRIKTFYRLIIILLLFLIPGFLLFQNFKLADQKNNKFAYNIADDIFATTPKDALLLVQGDAYSSSVLYAYLVEKKRQDLAIVFPDFFSHYNLNRWYISLVNRHFPDIILPPSRKIQYFDEYLQSVIEQNLKKRPVVCACGFANDNFKLTTSESVGLTDIYFTDPRRINLKKDEEKTDKILNVLKNTNPLPIFPAHYIESVILNLYSRPYVKIADSYFKRDDLENTERLLKKALPISHRNYKLLIPLANIYLKQGQNKKAIEAFEAYIRVNPYDEMVEKIQKQLTKLRGFE